MPKQKRARKRLSGYQCFFQNCLKEQKVQYPNSSIDLSVMSSKCAENWKKLDSAIKKRFQDEAEKVNAAKKRPPKPKRQPKQLVKMTNATKKCIQGQSKMLKKETMALKLKKPVSSFVLFSKEFRCGARRNHPHLTFGQISRVLAEMWRYADEKTKLKYKRLSLKQSERYRKEMNSSKIAGR